MKFTELKKFLQTKTLNNYMLKGNDSFLIEKSYELIKHSKSFEPNDLNISVFSEEIDFKTIVKALNTMPILSEYKLVYVNLALNENKLNNTDALLEYLSLPNPSSILIINVGQGVKDLEKLASKLEVIDCNKLDPAFVNAYVINDLKRFNKTISNEALKLLGEYTLYELATINGEIQKLISYVGAVPQILPEHVVAIVNKNIDYQIFDLTENLALKNAERVYEILSEIRAKKDNDKILIALIAKHFRRLFHISLNLKDTTNVHKYLQVKEYAVKVSIPQAKRFTQKQLKNIVDLCVELEFMVKTGEANVDNATNVLITSILNNIE